MRKLYVMLSLLVLASMILTACGGAAPTAAPEEPAATEAPAEEPAATEAPVEPAAGPTSADPTTLVRANSDISIDTLDPALAYDSASDGLIQNVYETLVFYDGIATDKFVPVLAESWETSDDGTVWTFNIRSGVTFHNGAELTPSDVAYSFQRGLLQGGYSSPQWLLAEPFYGIGVDDISLVAGDGSCADDRECMVGLDSAALVAACEKTKAAIVADDAAGTVTMTLAQAWGPFLPTIAQSWGAVLDQDWVVENGGWDGSCDTWQNFYAMDSASNPLSSIANGTGPYMLESLKQGEEVVIVRNDSYWGPAPAIERVIDKAVPEAGTRYAMLETGDADIAVVQVADRGQADELVGERCEWDPAANDYAACQVTDDSKPLRLYIGRPQVTQDVIIQNWDIATSAESPNPFLGSGKMDGNGVPPDFFADVHIRKAFGYCFDYGTLIDDVYRGEAVQPVVLTLPGMPGYNPDAPHYTTDLDKCAEEFKLADVDKDGVPAGEDPEGDVWTSGFRIQMAYNQGNQTRQTVAEILAGNLSQVNELFSLETLGLPWASYLRSQRARQLPLMTAGWHEDIHDPHNWYQPYTTGTYGVRQSLPDDVKAQFKDILDRGIAEQDPAARDAIYQEANQLYYDLAIGYPISNSTTHVYRQRWVHGWLDNPAFSDTIFYTMSKD